MILALVVAVAMSAAGQTQVIAVEAGDVVPFVGVCMTNDRAHELAIAEAEVQSCELKLAASQSTSSTWKEVAKRAVDESEKTPPKQPEDESGFMGGMTFGIGVVVGVAVAVGGYLLAGWTIGVARDASTE